MKPTTVFLVVVVLLLSIAIGASVPALSQSVAKASPDLPMVVVGVPGYNIYRLYDPQTETICYITKSDMECYYGGKQ